MRARGGRSRTGERKHDEHEERYRCHSKAGSFGGSESVWPFWLPHNLIVVHTGLGSCEAISHSVRGHSHSPPARPGCGRWGQLPPLPQLGGWDECEGPPTTNSDCLLLHMFNWWVYKPQAQGLESSERLKPVDSPMIHTPTLTNSSSSFPVSAPAQQDSRCWTWQHELSRVGAAASSLQRSRHHQQQSRAGLRIYPVLPKHWLKLPMTKKGNCTLLSAHFI